MKDKGIGEALRAELKEIVGEDGANEAIKEALATTRAPQIPEQVDAARNFVLGPLWQVLVEHRSVHRFAESAGAIVRKLVRVAEGLDPSAEIETTRYAVVVTSEPYLFQVARAHADDGVELRAARRLLDLAALSPLRGKAPVTVVVHKHSSPISLEALDRVTPALRRDCRILLAGVNDRELSELQERFKNAGRWESGGSLNDLSASL